MNFNEFQEQARRFAIYPHLRGVEYTALGLASEAGEYAGKAKKQIRDGENWSGEERENYRQEMAKELGDVLWYVAEAAGHLGMTLEEIARGNIIKLERRTDRGTLQGSGDNR